MPDRTRLPVNHGSAGVSAISRHIYQILVAIQQQRPEWIAAKYRQTPWWKPDCKAALIEKLTAGLSQATDRDSLLAIAKKYLQALLVPEFIHSPKFNQLLLRISRLTPPLIVAETPPSDATKNPAPTVKPVALLPPGIAILLLDTENLQLDTETEKFLQSICLYPIQIKVAFANWRSLGKKDTEFHERGYQLIHVPPGKDSADMKMAAVGASIFVHYPTAKEIFVCSSDQALIHLSNTLQAHGLTVYQVRKQGDCITILNSHTGQIQKYSLTPLVEVTPLERLLNQLKELIQFEQERTANQWVKLARVSALFKEKYNQPLNQAVALLLPGSKAQDIFLNYPQIFAVHKPSETAQSYVTLFDLNQPNSKLATYPTPAAPEIASLPENSINSLEDLEKAIVNIVDCLTAPSTQSYIFLSYVGSEFQRQYGKPITQFIKDFNLSRKFPKFLQSCSSLKLRKIEKGWQVAVVKS